MLSVTIFDNQLQPAEDLKDVEVDYISLFNGDTHGPPALVAPGRENGARVSHITQEDDRVLFINTGLVPAYLVEDLGN